MKFISYIICLSMLFTACNNRQSSHNHEGCDHDHDHDHGKTEQARTAHHHHDGEECDGNHDHDHDHQHDAEHKHDHDHECDGNHDHSHDGHNHAVTAGGHEHAADEIVIEPEQAKKLGVLSQQVQPGAFSMVIKTSGQVQAAQGDETTVVAPVSGVVSFSRSLSEGASVKKGESLLSISSQNIAEGDPVVKAKLAYEIAGKEYRRAVSLVKDTLISQTEFEQAQLNFETAKVTYDALSKSQTGKGTSASSSTDGYIRNRLVNEGEYVTTGQPLLTVSQNQKLYLRADVSEKYYAQLPAVVSANFKTPYDNRLYRLEDLKGRLVSFGRSADAASFYIPVVFEFDNVGTFVPGAFVEVYLLTGKTDNVLTLPLAAVIEDQGLYFVFEQISADAYKKQEVKIGDDNGQDVRILAGIHPGDRIVTQGALHVKLASNASSLPEHSHSH